MTTMPWRVHTSASAFISMETMSTRSVEQRPDGLSAHWAAVQSVLSLLHGFINAPCLHRVHVVPVQ